LCRDTSRWLKGSCPPQRRGKSEVKKEEGKVVESGESEGIGKDCVAFIKTWLETPGSGSFERFQEARGIESSIKASRHALGNSCGSEEESRSDRGKY